MRPKTLTFTLMTFIFFFSRVNSIIYGLQTEKNDPEIHIFIHVCTIGHWQEILERQLSRIHISGLYEACDSISLGVLGTEDITPIKELYPKLTILFQNPNRHLFERPTLLKLHVLCVSKPNDVVLYLHTKGVTHGDNPNVNDWTQLMEYFLIDRWRDCFIALKNSDVAGVNWNYGYIPPFFIGNFWWATSRYISTLPGHIGGQYLEPEFWIGTGNPNVKSFHQSNINHYAEPYPESKYILSEDVRNNSTRSLPQL